ncbi:hypothetical protein [Pseudarthrobacter sp. NamB4]|uniref:hypothetical protein n=1 Tax=Pseudarthrobacter sp. NamB4 TaxID=2576837 RepID=UPI0010FEB6A1|nr:hypothetical protein [Pseudarthrobacter sp. NamB4]TLM71638.1 hypothetical protein FDW81_15970 [Pseudarthrobacter sp. NamB4]
MTERELFEALAPVKSHFYGSKVTPGTVLAAYLRAAGMSAGGDDWQLAKAAFDAGMSFKEAVEEASAAAKRRRNPVAFPIRDAAANPKMSADPGMSVKKVKSDETTGSPIPDFRLPRADTSPRTLLTARREAKNSLDTNTGKLKWFPKVCGPGDIIGDGAKKLLGQPKLDPIALLVRETAQNSWDARLADSIDFTINLRKLSLAQQTALRDRIFTGSPQVLGLNESLAQQELWVLEVSDRGTKGLGGPVRNDLPIDPLEPTDFIDLIFNIGAPRDVHLGGGTYGFGKTVGYLLSRCGTTLIWSRCRTASGIEDRLIGSAIGGGYEDARNRYTGRHWWGTSPTDHEGIEPALGHAAKSLGEATFSTNFEVEDTGTSILIVDPDLGGDSPAEYAAKIAEAALWNLWPKFVPTSDGLRPMTMQVQLNGENVPLPAPSNHPVLSAYVECLQAVRTAQTGNGLPASGLVSLEEVWSQRPRKLLGHLAMTRFVLFDQKDDGSSEVNPIPGGSHHVCLMRHAAELVVRYDEGWALDQPGYQWAGVFRPVAGADDSFALSEPPAHDDWVIESLKDRRQKSEVKVAFTRLRELTRSFVAPSTDRYEHGEMITQPTVGLAEALGGILVALGGVPDPLTRAATRSRGKRVKSIRPTVTVSDRQLVASPVPASVRAVLAMTAQDPNDKVVCLAADVSAVSDGGDESLDSSDLKVHWSPGPLGSASGGGVPGFSYQCPSGTEVLLTIDFPADIALDIEVRVV